jgi:hypothetical protein
MINFIVSQYCETYQSLLSVLIYMEVHFRSDFSSLEKVSKRILQKAHFFFQQATCFYVRYLICLNVFVNISNLARNEKNTSSLKYKIYSCSLIHMTSAN